jgi:hypothetical protein
MRQEEVEQRRGKVKTTEAGAAFSKDLYMRGFHCFIWVFESEKNIYPHTHKHISITFDLIGSAINSSLLSCSCSLTTATICAPRFGLVGWVVGVYCGL